MNSNAGAQYSQQLAISMNGIAESRPKTNVRLTISANDLSDCDVFSKSDPFCVVFEKVVGRKNVTSGKITTETWKDSQWVERGRTEMIKNNLNPQFSKSILLPYFFEETQLLRFELYDVDANVNDFSAHDFLGRFECVLAQIVSYSNLKAHLGKSDEIGKTWKDGDKKTKQGSISIRGEEDEKEEKLIFDIRGEKLDKKDFLGKSDPYLNFWRKFDDGSSHLVHRTEVKMKTLDPRWNTLTLNVQSLCGKEKDRPILVECYDHDKWKNDKDLGKSVGRDALYSRDDLIGTARITLDQIIHSGAGGEEFIFELINDKKKAKKGDKYKNSGLLKIWNARVVQEPTFLDFIAGGTQLDFAVAIDFTASNGAVTHPRSLHHISSDRPNQYEIAIRSCLSICQHYSSSKRFDAFGFGAKLSPSSKVSEVFNLDLKKNTPSVFGVHGVMRAYRDALYSVQLYGPTNFAPIIQKVAGHAANIMMNTARYQVLLIITDGIISDMHKTISAIINASGLPLSIIIIGVGNEDFSKMEELDSDDKLLQQDSRIAQRDIVQFVTMRQFMNDGMGAYLDPEVVMQNLAREVLYEVPHQLTSYMKLRGLQPNSPDDPWPRYSPPPGFSAEEENFYGTQPLPGPSPNQPNPTQLSQPTIGFQIPDDSLPYPAAVPNIQQTEYVSSAPSAPPVDQNDIIPRF